MIFYIGYVLHIYDLIHGVIIRCFRGWIMHHKDKPSPPLSRERRKNSIVATERYIMCIHKCLPIRSIEYLFDFFSSPFLFSRFFHQFTHFMILSRHTLSFKVSTTMFIIVSMPFTRTHKTVTAWPSALGLQSHSKYSIHIYIVVSL